MLIDLIIILAVLAILWWVIQHFGLPQPFQIIVVAIFAIIAISLLLGLGDGGSLLGRLR